METANPKTGIEITQLTAINIAKFITILCLAALALVYGIHDERQVIYLCLHVSYCVWWMVEQWLFPLRRQQIFKEKADIPTVIAIILFVGVFYALPGYFAFTNPSPIGYAPIFVALPLYIFGSLINTGADVQKMVAKNMGQGLVNDGIWHSVRNINYLGDLMRYSSFSVVAGSVWAFVLPLIITLMYFQRINEKEKSMAAKYPDFEAYKQHSSRLLPWIW